MSSLLQASPCQVAINRSTSVTPLCAAVREINSGPARSLAIGRDFTAHCNETLMAGGWGSFPQPPASRRVRGLGQRPKVFVVRFYV